MRWRTTNPEHLALTATIDYSRDGGRSWRTIFVGPNTGHASLESFFFTASSGARIRVRISDGFNEAAAVSKPFAGPLPPGMHHLRLVARDPNGRTAASAPLNVRVSPVDLPFLKLTFPRRAGPRATRLILHGSATVPGTLTIGRHRFRLSRRRRTLILPISAGRRPLRLALSVAATGSPRRSRRRSTADRPSRRVIAGGDGHFLVSSKRPLRSGGPDEQL